MPVTLALALESTTDNSCLLINAQHELVSADFCTGDLVIPASVTTIKSRAFFYFKGSVSFEANSQLQTVERAAFYAGAEIKSIVFPPSLTSMDAYAVAATGNNVLYFEGNPAHLDPGAVWQSGTYTQVQPRGAPSLGLNPGQFDQVTPYQIDCNHIDGGKDFIGLPFVALELHNCRDPRNPAGANPPSRMGYIMNKNLNESVALQSVDGVHSGLVRLRQLGDSGMRLATTQEIDGSGFSVSAFGDQYDSPVNTTLSCQLSSSTPLPIGVSLTSDCKLEATSTTALTSSTTDININWVAHHGPSNAFDVLQSQATATLDRDASGSVGVRLSLRNNGQLTAAQLFQMKLLTAKYSGTGRDWNLAIAAYRALPADQIPSGTADSGILAENAVEQFEGGSLDESAATAVVDGFANQAAPQSTFLNDLRARVALQSATNSVGSFESGGALAKDVRQRILAVPASNAKAALLARFNARAAVLFGLVATNSAGVRTLLFGNPYAAEHFTVPAGVTQLSVQIQGAEGSQGGLDNGSSRPDRSGFKGVVQGTIAVVPGQVLTLGVGEAAGDAPSDCLSGSDRIALDSRVAKGGMNPLGGFSGGNGGSPGIDGCSGYGGAGGAASVIQVGDGSNPAGVATLVAGGSAGSSGSSDQYPGKIGLAAHSARTDLSTTNGQSGLGLWSYTFPDYFDWPSDGGGDGGGGGGAVGGAIGGYDMNLPCGAQDYCPLASAPGQNSTAGVSTLTSGYSAYSFVAGQNANGRITISYVEPSVNSDGSGGSGGTPSPTSSPTPTPTLGSAPDAPTGVVAVPLWRGAEVSWLAPASDGGSPIFDYRVTTPSGSECTSKTLRCRLTGLQPGQLLQVSVKARNAAGESPPATALGQKAFVPLSLNLWQVQVFGGRPKVKLLNQAQLQALKTMVKQDAGGYRVSLRLARNSSKLAQTTLRSLLSAEIRALNGQLRAAGLLVKVIIRAEVLPPNSKAERPSFILVIRKP